MKSLPTNQLKLKRKAGGCIVNRSPIYSNDGTTLFVAQYYWIQAYNTTTGAKIREYCIPSNNYIVAWENLTVNEELICICTNKGEIFFWNWRNGLEIQSKQLKLYADANIEKAAFLSYETPDLIEIFTTWSQQGHDYLKLTVHRIDSKISFKNIEIKFLSIASAHSLSVSPNSKLWVVAQNNEIYIGKLPSLHAIRHLLAEDKFVTATCCHPFEDCIVVGNNIGGLIILRNVFEKRPVRGIYHWHTLPINCCLFSHGGTHLYSGGNECVLVKWVVETPAHKQFLPRVMAPIKHIAISSDNTQVAYAMANNTIQLIDNQRNIKLVLENMSWGFSDMDKDVNPFVAGMHYNAKLDSIIMNSHTGHIQFYNPFSNTLVYHLDITEHTKLTQERNENIINIDVVLIAISDFGQWLATVEQRNESECFECRLKFWKYSANDQTWTLNTCVTNPHENGVRDIKFKPSKSKSVEETNTLLISIGANDKKFKTWDLVDTTTIYDKRFTWRNLATGYYLQKDAKCLDFSYDGSLVGIGFESSLTIWLPDTCELKLPLVYTPFADEALKQITFGKSDCCYLVVSITDNRICVWNLLSLLLVWTVPLKVNLLCSDPRSSYIAAFTTNNKIFVFSPQSSIPVYQHNEFHRISNKNYKFLAGIFIPNKIVKPYKSWQQYSQLFFIDSNYELLTLEDDSSSPSNGMLESITKPISAINNPYLVLKAKSELSNVHINNANVNGLRQLPGAVSVQELIKVSSHTSAPMRFLCESVLKSLVLTVSNIDNCNKLVAIDSDYE